MTGGDFSAEAYEALRKAYANETTTQTEAETKGKVVAGQQLSLETIPVDSPWKSKIDNWEYPTGRSAYLDGKQDPAEILEIMRGAAKEIDDEEKLEEAKELVAEAEADVEANEDEDSISDEDLDEFINELLNSIDDDEDEATDDEEEEGEEAEESEDQDDEETLADPEEAEDEGEEEEEEEFDLEAIAEEISRLKEELADMRFVPSEDPEENA